jgi:Asp-tRNA(Asn)/Glu-tRNA(Gln) amidotransferase A subunit family amidase
LDERELCFLPAVSALEQFSKSQLSPVELLNALIARAQEVEPSINAFTDRYFEEALEKAALAEQRYAEGNARPLEGLPIAIKDEVAVGGKRSTQGSLLLQEDVSECSGFVVERLEEAGAIIHARTATPEFCLLFQTYSRLWGVARNPWNLEITPGGSSGGSAASLAAGTSTLASGSDIGGSIRQPASMCGLVGFMPPYGRNPEEPPFNLDPYNRQGPLARTVADCALMQNIMSGPHPRDIATVRPKIEIPLELETNLKGWRIAYSIDLGYVDVDAEVVANTLETLEIFRSLGAVVNEVELNWSKRVDEAALHSYDFMMGAYIREIADGHEDQLCDYSRDYIERSRHSGSREFLSMLNTCAEMYDRFGPMMEENDLFVCPTATTTRVKADFNYLNDRIEINGHSVDSELSIAMCHQFNMLGRCPVLSVPSGMAENGVPTGVQLVGRTYDDERVFRAGAALEAVRPRFQDDEARPPL